MVSCIFSACRNLDDTEPAVKVETPAFGISIKSSRDAVVAEILDRTYEFHPRFAMAQHESQNREGTFGGWQGVSLDVSLKILK